MITLVEALRFRSLESVRQPLTAFEVLAGPHASGKTAFLDVIAMLGRLVSSGLDAALAERAASFEDLVWRRCGTSFELAIEARIPDALAAGEFHSIRYEVAVGMDGACGELAILEEKVLLRAAAADAQTPLFPAAPATLLTGRSAKAVKTVVHKNNAGNDNFYDESGKGWDHAFRLGRRRSALGNLPDDEAKFPISTWLRDLLSLRLHRLAPEAALLARPSPPGQPAGFLPSGANFPWVVEALRAADPGRFRQWLARLSAALPDLADVATVERPDDRHRYLLLRYRNGFEAPSWMASRGSLRLMALTLPSCLPEFAGVWLVDKPESGIHPRAVQGLLESLEPAGAAQVLLNTYSPVILGEAPPDHVLHFHTTATGATEISRG